MATITTRSGKGSPLTNTEVDNNFTNLNADKVEKSGDTLTGDLAFGDNVKAKFGASDDLQIYANSGFSYIDETGAGNLNLRTNGANIGIYDTANSQYMARFTTGGDAELYYNGSEKLATTSSGVDITGTVVADKFEATSTSFLESTNLQLSAGFPRLILLENDTTNLNSRISHQNGALRIETLNDAGTTPTRRLDVDHSTGDISFYEDTGTTAKLTWDASAEELQFKDSVKAEFGDGGDFQIEHNGTNTKLTNQTGTLKIVQNVNDGDVEISSDDGSGATALYFVADGSTGEAILYHYGTQKLATKSTGIDVTSTGNTTLKIHADTDTSPVASLELQRGANNTWGADVYTDYRFRDEVGDLFIEQGSSGNTVALMKLGDNSDISFYADDGTSQDFYWDASTSRLGLGTTSPAVTLDVYGNIFANSTSTTNSSEKNGIYFGGLSGGSDTTDANSAIVGFRGGSYTEGELIFKTLGSSTLSERMRIDSSGNVGIGTTSPSGTLSIDSTGSAQSVITTSGDGSSYVNLDIGGYAGTPSIKREVAFFTNVASAARTERMRIAADGKVGIGTTSPWSTLSTEFGSNMRFSTELDGSGNPTLDLYRWQGVSDYYNASRMSCLADGSMVFSNDTSSTAFATKNFTERMRIDSSGSFLVGKTSSGVANEGFEVNSNNYVAISKTSFSPLILSRKSTDGTIVDLRINNNTIGSIGNSGTLTYLDGNTGLIFKEGGSEAMRIDSSGRVGIGTTSPGQELHVQGGTGLEADIRIAGNGGASSYLDLFHNSGAAGVWNASNTPLQFATNATERMRIDSSGNLLVGTTDAFPPNNTGSNNGAVVSEVGAFFASRESQASLVLNRTTSDGDIAQFNKDGTTVGSIGVDNSDNIFLSGDSSHSGLMAGSNGILPYANGSTTNATEDLGQSGISWRYAYLSGGIRADTLAFSSTSGSEYGRFDSSGNLLVGTTSEYGTNGISLRSSGQVYANRDNNTSGVFNRGGTDGAIVNFSKDGTTVGSIGCDSGLLTIGESGQNQLAVDYDTATGINGVRLQNSGASGGGIIIANNGTTIGPYTDDSIILGNNSQRFKNLYLSGGVYLGGAGSANLLDDYEEGTFTPSFSDGTNTATLATASYTKIGQLVQILISDYNVNTSSLSGSIGISNLPFATSGETGGTLYYRDGTTAGTGYAYYISSGSTTLGIRKNGGPSASATNVSATSNATVFVSITYKTAS